MISKPPSNWSDEDKAVTAARSAVAVAQYATGATKRGFSLVKAIGLGLIAALWGLAGLAQMMIGGLAGGASQAGAGILTMLLAAIPGYFAWRTPYTERLGLTGKEVWRCSFFSEDVEKA